MFFIARFLNNLKIGKPYQNYQTANSLYLKYIFKRNDFHMYKYERYFLLLDTIEAINISFAKGFRVVHSTFNLLACVVLMSHFNGKRYLKYYGYGMFILYLFVPCISASFTVNIMNNLRRPIKSRGTFG